MSLGSRVVSAAGWSVVLKGGFQIVMWAVTLFVIRILSPDDYGLMALTMVCVSFLAGFTNLGLGDALVQQTNPPAALIASVSGVLLAFALALSVGLASAAYPIAGGIASRA